ncbi:MAG: SUMF1/EgtB/PvdO family nonheme iron enzyme [Planctomyces sp.]
MPYLPLQSVVGIKRRWARDESSAIRVIRGGSWDNSAQNVRAAYRNGNHPGNRDNNLGFRCSSSRGNRMVSP